MNPASEVEAWVCILLFSALSGAVLLFVLWRMSIPELERAAANRRSVSDKFHRWAAERGGARADNPDPALLDSSDPRRRQNHDVVAAAEMELAGRRALLLLCETDPEAVAPMYATVILRMPVHLPALRVRQWFLPAWLRRRRNPAPPDASAVDHVFHRRLTINHDKGTSDRTRLTDPVRDALLRLSEIGDSPRDLVDLQDGILRVAVGGWPPQLDLDLLVETVSELVLALDGTSEGLPPVG